MFTYEFNRYFCELTVYNKKKIVVLWGRNNFKTLWITVTNCEWNILGTQGRETINLTKMGIAGVREEKNILFPLPS